MRQVGINTHIEAWRSAFDPAQDQVLDRIEADHAVIDGIAHAGGNVVDREHF